MSSGDSITTLVLAETGRLLLPLGEIDSQAAAEALLRKLGYEPPKQAALKDALTRVAGTITGLLDALDKLETASDPGDEILAVAAIVRAATAVLDAVRGGLIDDLGTALSSAPGYLSKTGILDELPRRLTDLLFIQRLRETSPGSHGFLLALGLLEETPVTADPASFRPDFVLHRVRWDLLPLLFTDPGALAESACGLRSGVREDDLLGRVATLLRALRVPGGMYPQDPAIGKLLSGSSSPRRELRIPLARTGAWPDTYAEIGFSLSGVPASDKAPAGLALTSYAHGAARLAQDVGGGVQLTVEGAAGAEGGFGLVVRPPDHLTLFADLSQSNKPAAAFDASVSLTRSDPDEELLLLGSKGSSRVAVRGPGARVFATSKDGSLDAGIELRAKAVELRVEKGDADGLLQRFLPLDSPEPLFSMRDLTVGFSAVRGLYFGGEAGLARTIAVNRQLGPFFLDSVRLGVTASEEGIGASATLSGGIHADPVTMSVKDIGVALRMDLTKPGNLGPASLAFAFEPPSGLGIAVDAAMVKGGGFLSCAKGRYEGALSLTVEERIGLQVAGVVVTRTPDDRPTFSFKMLGVADMSAAPIQLGLGFSLTGLGLAVAVACRMDEEALRAGVYDGSLRSLLFPPDLAERPAKVLSDLDRFFPAKDGAFVVGAMARLGWGAGIPLVQADVGLFLEVCRGVRLALAGTVTSDLPGPRAPLLRLRAEVLGLLDLPNKTVSVDASLSGSSVLDLPLQGDLALRASWGARPRFALSAGGFYPGYAAPPGFPALRRLGLVISSGNPSIGLVGYFAVTENSAQIGAQAYLEYKKSIWLLGELRVSGSAGFDALFQFNPFRFEAGVFAGCSVALDGDTLLGVDVTLTLSGPNPYHAVGSASFEVLGFGVSVGFDETFGSTRPDPVEQIDPLPLMLRELRAKESWRVVPGPSRGALLAPSAPEGLADPGAKVRFEERALPLGVTIDRVGNARVSGPVYFDVVPAGGGLNTPVYGGFAPGDLFDLTDAQKIAAPPFEELRCGLELQYPASEPQGGTVVAMSYETLFPDESRARNRVSRRFGEPLAAIGRRGAPAAKDRFPASARTGTAELREPRFADSDGRAAPPSGVETTWTDAFSRARGRGPLGRVRASR